MNYFKLFVVLLFIFYVNQSFSQTLILNEVSNGPTGNQEYAEFLVVSNTVTYSCNGSTPPCIDIRGWIFDDNSGYHGTSGVASGAVRFSNNPIWACVPLGTIILIYNNLDRNPAIPPDDLLMSDGNCKIIAPINSNLFESISTTPGAIACSYPSTGWTSGGNWNNTVLANPGDCARIVNLAGCEVFSLCYGSDNLNNLIYFSGAGGQTVYYFNNINPNIQANWSSGIASASSGLQTPGTPNNALNAAYISQFNNSCTPITNASVSVSSSTVNAGCNCSGSITATAMGSIGPFTYLWSNGQTTATATGLCPGIYTVTSTSNIGCSSTATVQVFSSSTLNTSFDANTYEGVAPLVVLFTNTSINPSSTNYSWNFGNSTTSFATNTATATYLNEGIYTVMLIANNGGCIDTTIKYIKVENSSTINVPNVFTPNGDGKNDLFLVEIKNISEINLTIFDRWGLVMFECADKNKLNWDGKTKQGNFVTDGEYFYIINAKGFDNQKHNLKGTVNVFKK